MFRDGIRVFFRETRIDHRPERRVITSADSLQHPDLVITFPKTIHHSKLSPSEENQSEYESERLSCRILFRLHCEPLKKIDKRLVIHEHLPLGTGVRNFRPPPAEQPFTQFLSRFFLQKHLTASTT